MRKLALCVGINDYPDSGMDLAGCVNDALDWGAALRDRGYTTNTLLDSDATKVNVVFALRQLVAQLRFGDRLVFTYSGHGSWVPDQNGDEADLRDECLVLHDWDNAGYLTDDEMYEIWKGRRWGSRVTVISDSCHSGTVARFANLALLGGGKRTRYFPADMLDHRATTPRTRKRVPSALPDTVLMSGCGDLEYSYDAQFGQRANGAFTFYAVNALEAKGNPTMHSWMQAVREFLPDPHNYPQTPQLTAKGWQQWWRL